MWAIGLTSSRRWNASARLSNVHVLKKKQPDTPLVRWLRERVRIAEREAKAYAAEGQYGEAGKAIGRAEGYAFTVLHIEFEANCHER